MLKFNNDSVRVSVKFLLDSVGVSEMGNKNKPMNDGDFTLL